MTNDPGCFGKQQFDSRAIAQRVVDRTVKRRKVRKQTFRNARLTVYKCETCNKWHYGA